MITLRCTKKLQKFLEIDYADILKPASATLGDWYANLIPTFAGDLIIFVNEKSLLSVAIPIWESKNLFPVFRIRVANLLGMIGIYSKVIEKEISHFDQIQFGKTVNRSVLGSMNDFAWHYQIMAQEANSKADLSLSNAELKLSQMPCKPLDYSFPSEIAKELLSEKRQNTT
jgi:hypothetical protein